MNRMPLFALVLFVFTTAGCGKDSVTNPNVAQPDPTDLTVPAEVVTAIETALNELDVDTYAALLEETPIARAEAGFRYYPQSSDLQDFPWITGDFWSREEELDMIGNMCDPEFVSDVTQESVDSIDAEITVLSQQTLPSGEIEVTTSASITVLWAAQDGARCDVILVLLLAEDSDGYLRIREMSELPTIGRVEDTSWGNIKSLYRS
ncbi:MAG: hypothetical protein KC591_18005 [Gemmatimonadetes bacterium]|nr:hypothetical protein [Gemmatimonadota bacterium]